MAPVVVNPRAGAVPSSDDDVEKQQQQLLPNYDESSPAASATDEKVTATNVENATAAAAAAAGANTADAKAANAVVLRGRLLEAPEFVRSLAPERRAELEKQLKRKIDTRLLPAIIVMYILNYIDRNNIAAARLAGLERDLHLSSVEFQTAVSILFVGYLLMQIPSNLFLNKIGKPAIYLPACMIVWGMISAATAACTTAGGLLANRFFLGFVEAAYFPGCLYYLSCWYTRAELGFRTAVLYSGALISGAFSGFISAGVTWGMDGTRGLGAWQWLFIIEGVATVFIAFGAFFVLPNFPRTTTWLTEEERILAVWRLDEDIGEDDWTGSSDQTFWQGAKLAFLDPKIYVLMLLLFCIVASGTVTNFFPTVVNTIGYSSVVSLLLTTPPYVLAVIVTYANAAHADRTGERYWHIAIPMWVAIIAYIIAATTTATGPRYFSMMLMVPSVYSGFVVALAWISNTMPRPPAKRAAALAFINAVSNCSSIYASYLYPTSAGPHYTTAMVVNCVTAAIAVCAATVMRFILVGLNRKLAAGVFVDGAINSRPGEPVNPFRFKI
ncbi:major facilitator superfamily domain-containing protein [Lasiosphaeria miniovina]|uniref:Major facilitator superfamily domain-containing protein n=1 Tax=Lasiosphaeria miniovina TaxID=1954250 RepID=A0AA40E963_9PEZI|nr:major facilitator superfamily domain-containing protein [Lasiosphaeria miniovina]KAK0728661.1 major facilitator superfamily domain-containing protein [Lasiosphaeria miniovina]